MEYKEQFSKRLVQLREKIGITQQELADKLEITRQSLSLYEKAERTINIELLAKIADFFNVSTDYLMGRTDVSSINKDIQVACNVTGLSEHIIKHLYVLVNSGITNYDKNALESIISSINDYTLLLLGQYHRVKTKKEVFNEALTLKFCEENKIPISRNDIIERGEHIFNINCNFFAMREAVKYHSNFSEYKKNMKIKMDSAIVNLDPDLNEDEDYLKYKLSSELNDSILYQTDWFLYDDNEYLQNLFNYYYDALSFDWSNSEYANYVAKNKKILEL